MPKGVYKRSDECKKILSDAHKGQKSWNKGKKLSSEHIEKLRISHLGQKAWNKNKKGVMPTPWNKGMKGLNIGFPKGVANLKIRGANHHKWKGGITPIHNKIRNSLEGKLRTKTILVRDDFTCRRCSKHGGNLESHHINNFAEFAELRFALDNGITLCKYCHKLFHAIYDKKNNTKEQIIEFLRPNIGL